MVNEIVRPASLMAAVEYQPEAVASHVMYRNSGGTMTAFAFSEGVGLPEHTNPNDAIVLVLEGRASFTLQGRPLELEAGEMVHLPAEVPHAIHGGTPFKMLLTILKKHGD